MKKQNSFKTIFDRYTIYRSSRIGVTLIEILINLYKRNKIRTILIFKILNKFDEYIYFLLKKKVSNLAKIKGSLEEYRRIDELWYFTTYKLKFSMDIDPNRTGSWRIDAFCAKCDIMLIDSKKT